MFTLPPSLISWPSLQIFHILWLWSAVCMTDGIPDGCITLVLPCPAFTHIRENALNPVCVSVHVFWNPATVPWNVWSARMTRHTYAKMPQILYVSQYTIYENLLQCLETYGLQAEPDTHTQKALKSCMCLGTHFSKPCHSALKRVVCTHGQTHIHKNALNPVCVSVHVFWNPATVPWNVWSARMVRHTYAKMPQILYVSQYTFVETLLQRLIMHGLQAESDTHTQKRLKSCMCLNIVSHHWWQTTALCVVSVNWYITPKKIYKKTDSLQVFTCRPWCQESCCLCAACRPNLCVRDSG